MTARARPLAMPCFTEHIRQVRAEERLSGYQEGFVAGHRSGRFVWLSVGITVGLLLGAGIAAYFIRLGVQS